MIPKTTILAAVLLSVPATAQIQYSVRSVNDAGVAIERGDGTRVVSNFPAGTAFPGSQTVSVSEGSQGGLFGGPTSQVYHTVFPPMQAPLPLPGLNRVDLQTTGSMHLGVTHNSAHTAGNTAGDPGAQIYDVTVTTNGSTQVEFVLRATSTIHGRGLTSMRVTGGGIDETFGWTGATRTQRSDTRLVTIPVNGSVTLRVELFGFVSPGAPTFLFDGFAASMGIEAFDVGRLAFRLFGNGCGSGVMAGSGVPVLNQDYTINLDNAPANQMAILVLGQSRSQYLFLPLPLPLGFMGATGCDLNVSIDAQSPRVTDANGHAEVTFRLWRALAGTQYYLQWVVLDPNAPGGLTTTRGGELVF